MKMIKKASALFFGVFCLTFILTSCGDDGGTTIEPAKTLNKELLYDKVWVSEHVKHIFNSDGTYHNVGTWKWINDSDSMLIDAAPIADGIYVFEWSTESQMSCKRHNHTQFTTYTLKK